GQEIGMEDLLAPVKRVTRKPDHLLVGEADRARMIELFAQLGHIDLVGEPYILVAVDERKGDLDIGIDAADHLQHQQLVEIRIQQAAEDRVQFPGMVVDPPCDIRPCHHFRSFSRRPPLLRATDTACREKSILDIRFRPLPGASPVAKRAEGWLPKPFCLPWITSFRNSPWTPTVRRRVLPRPSGE